MVHTGQGYEFVEGYVSVERDGDKLADWDESPCDPDYCVKVNPGFKRADDPGLMKEYKQETGRLRRSLPPAETSSESRSRRSD